MGTIQPFDAEEFFSFLQSLPEDEILNEILELSKRLIRQKPELVQKIREVEDTLSLHHRNVTISKITGSSVGIASGISFIAGIALAPITFGASLGLTIGGGIAGLLGGATFVGADIKGNQLIKQELEKIQSELSEFHRELEVLAQFDHQERLAQNVRRFGETLIELEGLSETEFNTFLKKTQEAVTKYLGADQDAIKTDVNQMIQQALDLATDDKMIRSFMQQFLMACIGQKTRADLEHLRTILQLLNDSAQQTYCYIKKVVHFIIPLMALNDKELPVGAIARGVAGGTIAGFKVASGAGQTVTKIAPQLLKGLGYAAGGIAIVVDLGFLIHTCVTMDDVPHVGTLRSLADQMDEMDLESVSSSEYWSCSEE